MIKYDKVKAFLHIPTPFPLTFSKVTEAKHEIGNYSSKNARFDVAQGKLLLQRLSSAGVMRAWEEWSADWAG